MRIVVIGLAVAVAGCTMPPPAQQNAPINELAGRVAGAAQRCVPIVRGESLRPASRSTLLYGHGKTLWLNQFQEGCSGLNSSDILILEPIGSQYCRGDFVRTRDNVSGLPGAGCRLGDFVPYTRG